MTTDLSVAWVRMLAIFMFFAAPLAVPAGAEASGGGSGAYIDECGQGRWRTLPYRWCVSRPDSSEPNDVILFLHGANRNERDWMDSPFSKTVNDTWNHIGARRPSIVSVSFGSLWLLQDRGGGFVPVHRDAFVQHILPAIEARLRHPVAKRMIVGTSMGGFNAAQLLFKHPQMFDRVALLCPMMPTVNPHSSRAEKDAYIERHRPYIDERNVRLLLDNGHWIFRTRADWDAHDPLLMVRNVNPGYPKIHLSCGDRDTFGFFEGAEIFARAAQERGASLNWIPIAGAGHCQETPESLDALAKFLVGFGEAGLLASGF